MIDISAGILKILGTGTQAAIEFYPDAATVTPTARLYLQADGTLNTDVSGGAGAGEMQTHALDGGLHTGTLANVQAPQFLLLDGTRSMTGSLTIPGATVNGNIVITGTVDGVDVSAHAADADAHHNHATIGAGGLSAKLAFTDQVLTLAVIDHADLSNIVADQHHNQSHALSGGDHTGDLSFTQLDSLIATPAIALGTAAASGSASTLLRSDATIVAFDVSNPVTIVADASASPGDAAVAARRNHVHAIVCSAPSTNLSVSSTNTEGAGDAFARATHTHAITASSAPGAAAALLKSTAAGGLTLQSLALSGSLDITDGDLTVLDGATTVFFVDESAHNVGVMTNTPDAQFALDVDGPIRGQYLVGPHAIQLSDAVMICHFDGSYPFETNYDVDTTGHLGQVATVSGGVIGRPGKFGKAAQIAEATTNLHINPSLGTNGTGYVGSYRCAFSRVTEQARFGEYSAKFVADATATNFYGTLGANIAGVASTAYTVSVWVYAAAGNTGTARLDIVDYHATYTEYSSAYTSGSGWQRLSVTFTTDATHTHFSIRLRGSATSAPDDTYYIDGVQAEQKAYVTPYCDGSLDDGHSWSGTAHASTSSRTAGRATYPDVALPQSGTFMVWVMTTAAISDNENYRWIFDHGYTGGLLLYIRTDDYLAVVLGESTRCAHILNDTNFPANTWHQVAVTWDATNSETKMYLNGAQIDSTGGYATLTDDGGGMDIGQSAGSFQWPGFIDEVAFLERALSAVEVRAIYESSAPVFAETSIRAWRSPGQVPIWVNEEGLWGRDADGNASLGWSSVDGKSWGGQTLNKGDFLLGYSTEYMLWDSSAATLNIAGGITAERGVIGGWTITATELANTNIWLDAAALQLAIKSQVFGQDGIQLEYNAGNPRAYIGDGANAYLNFDGVKITWKAANTELDASGNLTASSATLSGAITAVSGELQSLSVTGLLDMAAGGKIRVGTGTKDADLTGWLIDNTEIVGQNGAGTDEVCLTSEGKITAGAGAVTIDAIGLSLASGTGNTNKIRWASGANTIGEIFGNDRAASGGDTIYMSSSPSGTNTECTATVSAVGNTGPANVAEFNCSAFTSGTNPYFVFDLNASTVVKIVDSDLRVVGGLYVGSISVDPAPGTIIVTDYLYINETSNVKQTLGLTINQGANDDEIFAAKSSDVAHGMTDYAETDTYGTLSKANAGAGGLRIIGYRDAGGSAGDALSLFGRLGEAADTAKSTSASGVVNIFAQIKSGTGIADVGADGNLVVIRNNATARFIFDAEGSAHADVEWTTFDDYDDIALLADLERAMLAERDPLKAGFVNFLRYNHATLEDAGLVHFDRENPGHAMLNTTRLSMALVGALRQLGARMNRVERRQLI